METDHITGLEGADVIMDFLDFVVLEPNVSSEHRMILRAMTVEQRQYLRSICASVLNHLNCLGSFDH